MGVSEAVSIAPFQRYTEVHSASRLTHAARRADTKPSASFRAASRSGALVNTSRIGSMQTDLAFPAADDATAKIAWGPGATRAPPVAAALAVDAVDADAEQGCGILRLLRRKTTSSQHTAGAVSFRHSSASAGNASAWPRLPA